MGANMLLPIAGALFCLEMCVAFALLFVKISRRRANLLFSLLSLALAWMLTAEVQFNPCDPMLQAPAKLFWLRMQYVGAYLAVALFFDFVSEVVNEPMRRVPLALNYFLGLWLAGVACTSLFLSLPAGPKALRNDTDFIVAAQGPAYPLFMIVLVLAFTAWLKLIRGWRAGSGKEFAPLARQLRVISAGAACLILSGPALVVNMLLFPTWAPSISPQSVGALAFAACTAMALGRELLRGEAEKRRLEALVEFRGQAVRDVAHELKNPLAGIQMAAAAALESARQGGDCQVESELLEMCVDDCKRLTRLINNMLDTARMEAGRSVELRVEETDVPALVQAVIARQQTTTVRHHLVLRSDAPRFTACLDPDKLHQILTNLVGNAIKYSPDGGEITVSVSAADGEVQLSVSDRGIGISAEQQARLFEQFERLVDPGRKITGTGIGLHLVKRLVEAQGGSIWAESAPGRGSTFHVRLPRVVR